jgi:hypothetical protein
MCPSSAAAKTLLQAELNRLQLPTTCLSVRTVGLLDLPQNLGSTVTVHGWQPNPAAWARVQHFARVHGFRVHRGLVMANCPDVTPEASRRVRVSVQRVSMVPTQANLSEQLVPLLALV